MKTIVVILSIVLVLAIFVSCVVLWIATPHDWPMTAGTITAKKVLVEGKSFVIIDGQPINYLGQIQSINLDLDEESARLVVSRCLIRWNPLNKIIVNNQWPVFYPLDGVKAGEYKVVYRSPEGLETAGKFNVP